MKTATMHHINQNSLQNTSSQVLQAIPPATNLVIAGIEQEKVNETRLGYINKLEASKGKGAKQSATTKRLASSTKQQKQPETGFRLIETIDASLGMVMAAKAIKVGLEKGESIILVSPQKSNHLMGKLEMLGVDVESALSSRKLAITQFEIDDDKGLNTNYRASFGELFKHANTAVDTIVIMDMDTIVNLESQNMAYTTVSKFTQAVDEMGCKVITQYTRNQSEEHDRLDAACSSLVNAYFAMSREEENGKKYLLRGKNRPI